MHSNRDVKRLGRSGTFVICVGVAAATVVAATADTTARRPVAVRFLDAPHADRPIAPAPLPPRPLGRLAPSAPAYPLYRWPLGGMLGDGLLVVNYVDHDPSGGLLDYEGGAHTYDGHAGIDYTLYNFRLMDRGCPVVAAAGGTVAYMGAAAPGAFDRSCSFSTWPDDGNWIWIHNGDGTYSEYYHFRSWSLTVNVGDVVQPGQILGMVGSSGYSTAPHLHFGTGDYFSGPYTTRDPYSGPVNPLPSLWLSQEDYQGDDPLRFVDMGIFSEDAVGGSVFNTTYCDLQEGVQQPLVFGIDEPTIPMWFQFQGNPGDAFRIELLKPDESVWAAFDDVLGYDALFGWFWAYFFWSGGVGPADYGAWTLRAYALGSPSLERRFTVGPSTSYGPRLQRAGRSFRVSGVAQKDTLRVTRFSPPIVSWTLIGAPGGVTLSDSVLTVGPASSQPSRSAFFRVAAGDASARSDTAFYHMVDMSKPLEAVVEVPETPAPGPAVLRLSAHPNPSAGTAALDFEAPAAGTAEVAVIDVAGRRIRHWTVDVPAAGPFRVEWDGRDVRGRRAPAGLYVVRVSVGAAQGLARLVVSR